MSRRTTLLLGILLTLVIGMAAHLIWNSDVVQRVVDPKNAPLPGENRILSAEVRRGQQGDWQLHVSYHYTGHPAGAYVQSALLQAAVPGVSARPLVFSSRPGVRGTQELKIEVVRQGGAEPFSTQQVLIEMRHDSGVLAGQTVDQKIDWPDFVTWFKERELARKSPAEILNTAIALIDTGSREQLEEARRLLERLIRNDQRFDPAYVELARVAMKTNWGPEGLRQAENLLASALQIRPDSVNAKVLVGYVYTHQGRYKDAEAVFEDASKANSKNLWLWANWGELLAKQGRETDAIAKYQETITRPRTHDTYDRARLMAYSRLIEIQGTRNDVNAQEALHKQRTEEFGAGSCYGAEYSRFLVQQRGDHGSAISLARQATSGECDGSYARDVLGLAYYAAWASADAADRDDLLRQARIYLPGGPRLIYQLASSDRTLTALQRLKATGESIEQLDNRHYNALALALDQNDLATAKRLLKLGANVMAPIGPFQMPVALLPVVGENVDAIRLMQRHGVDYGKLRFQGMTALEHARRTGNRKLLEVLDRQANSS